MAFKGGGGLVSAPVLSPVLWARTAQPPLSLPPSPSMTSLQTLP